MKKSLNLTPSDYEKAVLCYDYIDSKIPRWSDYCFEDNADVWTLLVKEISTKYNLQEAGDIVEKIAKVIHSRRGRKSLLTNFGIDLNKEFTNLKLLNPIDAAWIMIDSYVYFAQNAQIEEAAKITECMRVDLEAAKPPIAAVLRAPEGSLVRLHEDIWVVYNEIFDMPTHEILNYYEVVAEMVFACHEALKAKGEYHIENSPYWQERKN